MHFKKKITILIFLVLLLAAVMYFLPLHPNLVRLYSRYVYYPIQSFRITILGIIPVSIGDMLYVVGGLALLLTLVRWGYYIYRFGAYKDKLAASFLRLLNIVLFVYFIFLVGWGVNYYKAPLRVSWKLPTTKQRKADSAAMVLFDHMLTDRLNAYAPHYHSLSFSEVNERSTAYYRIYTDSKVKGGLGIKPSLFGYFMERIGVDGYYNPFTGEGQVSRGLPAFMMPFVICHEMAHQAGIAAEDDANLMAYALGTVAHDSSFNYSAYLNLWLYANARVYRRDSAMAKGFEAQLNGLTRAHIDTLDELSKKYHNQAARYSSKLYDGYLRMQNQKDGIRSYGNVAALAWQLEQGRRGKVIKIP